MRLLRPWLPLIALGIAACSDDTPAPELAGADLPEHPSDWRCGDLLLRITPSENDQRLLVELPGGRRVLSQTPSASGVRYSEPTGTVFFSKGADEATLTLPGAETPKTCRPSDVTSPWITAREAGLRARAAGNEPGWLLELAPNGDLRLLRDYGETEDQFQAHSRSTKDGSLQVDSAEGRLQAHFRAEPCVDSMSGQRFPMQVKLRFEDSEYRGCGRVYESRP